MGSGYLVVQFLGRDPPLVAQMSTGTDTTTVQVSRDTLQQLHRAHAQLHGAQTKQKPLEETVKRAVAELEADDE